MTIMIIFLSISIHLRARDTIHDCMRKDEDEFLRESIFISLKRYPWKITINWAIFLFKVNEACGWTFLEKYVCTVTMQNLWTWLKRTPLKVLFQVMYTNSNISLLDGDRMLTSFPQITSRILLNCLVSFICAS